MTPISKTSHLSGTRCAPPPSGMASFLLSRVLSPPEKVRNNGSSMKADTSPTRQPHRVSDTHHTGTAPSILVTHLLRKSILAIALETLPPQFLGKFRAGPDSPSVRTGAGAPYLVPGILQGRRHQRGGRVSTICPPSRITRTGSTLSLPFSMMLHNRCQYTHEDNHQTFLGPNCSRFHQSWFRHPH